METWPETGPDGYTIYIYLALGDLAPVVAVASELLYIGLWP